MPENNFQELVNNITNIRIQKASAFDSMSQASQSIKLAERNLSYALDNSLATSDILIAIEGHTANFNAFHDTLNQFGIEEAEVLGQYFSIYDTHQYAVSQLNDSIPVLLFPVKIETIFKRGNKGAYELWVRIFPDDIVVDSHEPSLTVDEIDQGKLYWASIFTAQSDVDKIQAWDLLSRSYRAQRAAWVALQTMPSNLVGAASVSALNFPTLTPKSSSWSRQPNTRVLPDAFIINCYRNSTNTTPDFSYQTNHIADDLKMGFDPARNDSTFLQTVNGDLATATGSNDPGVSWLINFDAAVAAGMGAKIPITEDAYNHGFDRVMVVGIKASITKEEGQSRLQNLINAHHYTDGFALLKQGTCTNNTGDGYSGYSAVEFGNNTTYATEKLDSNLFTPVVYNRDKTDGQFLCEALGIDFGPLYHIFHANGYDIRDSMNINSVLWGVAVGYYVGSLLVSDVDTVTIDPLRDFYTDFVRSRGALPSIRSGKQPYGILPTSVFSRMQWSSDPKAGLYSDLAMYTEAVSGIWANAALTISGDIDTALQTGNHAQPLFNIVSRNAVSRSRVQRMGFGAGYIWNNLVYARNQGLPEPEQWFQQFQQTTQQIQDGLGIPLSPQSAVTQLSYMPEHADVPSPIVSSTPGAPGPLPGFGGSDINYLQILSEANFTEIRDQNYSRFGVADGSMPPEDMLYRFARQSLMLDYFDAATKLLGISDQQRAQPEFINIVQEEGQQPPPHPGGIPLSYGGSRWAIMDSQFQGGTIADFIDFNLEAGLPEVAYLGDSKRSLKDLSFLNTGDLDLLTCEVMDASSFRLDTWRLALVNQRLNAVRGITDGSGARGMGIYMGAYGWVENVRRDTTRQAPGSGPTGNFSGNNYQRDSANQGYIHAPSIAQAAAGAVLRSGYSTRASSNSDSTLSVNISSERVRSATDILDGIRNGQNLTVLLGYEFERYMYEDNTYSVPNIDTYIDQLRFAFTLQYPIGGVSATLGVADVQADNVLDGLALIQAYKSAPNTNAFFSAASIAPFTGTVLTGFTNSVDWIMNVMDAVGDLTTAESVYQVVAGNEARSSAVADAISRGSSVPEVELINTPKSGIGVQQRFTMHFEHNSNPSIGWNSSTNPISIRAAAEPYFNRWLGQILGDSANIQCLINIPGVAQNIPLSMADLGLQPIDLIYIINDELANDASELAVRIRRFIRDNSSYSLTRTDTIEIDFGLLGTTQAASIVSFEEVISIIRYARNLITASRSLKTTDYITSTDTASVVNNYDFSEFLSRALAARNSLSSAMGALNNANNAVLGAPTSIPYIQTLGNNLFAMGAFGLEQSVFEYHDTASIQDYATFTSAAAIILADAKKRIDKFDAMLGTTVTSTSANSSLSLTPPSTIADPDALAEKYKEAFKVVLDKAFIALPVFQLRNSEAVILNNQQANNTSGVSSTLLSGQTMRRELLMDSWVAGISKVRKNAATYELLAVLGSGLNLNSFTSDRELLALQTPYTVGGSDEWLGTKISSNTSLKRGRLTLGASVPKNVSPSFTWSGDLVGILVDEWMDMIPNPDEVSGIAFHANQPNAKPPQCLLLGLAPVITGHWQWNDLVDMVNDTFDLAKQRAVSYDMISGTAVGQVLPAFAVPFSASNATISFTAF